MKNSGKLLTISQWLSRRLINITVLIFFAAIIAVTVVSVLAVRNDSTKITEKGLDNARLQLESTLSGVASSVNTTKWIINRSRNNDDRVNVLLENVVRADSTVVCASIAFEPEYEGDFHMLSAIREKGTGRIYNDLLEDKSYEYTYLDWYQIAKLTGKPYWNDPAYDEHISELVTTYCMPLYDEDGKFYAVFKADIPVSRLSTMLEQANPLKPSLVLVVARNGSFIMKSDETFPLGETIFSDVIEAGSEKGIKKCQEMVAGGSGHFYTIIRKIPLYVFYEPMYNGWTIVSFCSTNVFYSNVRLITSILAAIALLGIILLYFVSRGIVKRLTKPIAEFSYAAQNMARGNFNARIPNVAHQVETKKLQDTMQYMQRTIKHYISELRETTSRQERIESELNIANSIQMSMLPPSTSTCDEFDLAASLTPAKEVGGDLYDVRRDGDVLCFSVGDVSGKGVPAALFMAITQSSFKFLDKVGGGIDASMAKINDTFSESNDNAMFVTLFMGRVNLKTLEMEFCNGGHNPIVVISPDGKARFLEEKPNLAVGLFGGFMYQGEKLQLEKGSRIIVYTDGITEAEDVDKNLYGEDRLLDFASRVPQEMTSQELISALIDDVHKFTDGNQQNDDMTVLSIKF